MIHGFTLLVHPPPGPTSSTDASREDRLRRVLDSMIKKVLSHGPAVLQKMDFPSFHGKSKMDQKWIKKWISVHFQKWIKKGLI
jgi:hypothetical protein